jgi:Tfp pilus assembly protein PilX
MHRLIRDESGMTLALTVFMIVIIGVMGAGLLTFVNRDLESVVEVNRGQRALKMADAGLEAAKRQLSYKDARPSSYDAVVTAGNSSWYDDGMVSSGQALTFDGNQIRVRIRYLTPSANSTQTSQPDFAPEVLPNYVLPSGMNDLCNDTGVSGGTGGDGVDDDLDLAASPPNKDACEYPNNRNYFRVTVRGEVNGAIRQIQAIYQTQNVNFPVGYFATRDINFNGNATTTDDVSFFSNRYVYNVRIGSIGGTDNTYGNWAVDPITGTANPCNGVARETTDAGIGALGGADPVPESDVDQSGIDYDPNGGGRGGEDEQKSGTAGAQQLYGFRDFDRDSNISATHKKNFARNTWGAQCASRGAQLSSHPNTITFPFETGNTAADDAIIADLKQKARDNGTYVRVSPDSNLSTKDHIIAGQSSCHTGGGAGTYPCNSSLTGTVYFVEFAGGTDDSPVYGTKGQAEYNVKGTTNADGLVKGTVVVVNGDLETSSSAGSGTNGFQGVMIVRDPNDADNTNEDNVMKYVNGGSFGIQGFVNVEGDISLQGSVNGFNPGVLVNGLPGLVDTSLWSWRECYTVTCS